VKFEGIYTPAVTPFTPAGDINKGALAVVLESTGATRTEDSVAYAKHAREIGAEAILVSSPPYALPTERENAIHALTIDRAADLPIMLLPLMAVLEGGGKFVQCIKSGCELEGLTVGEVRPPLRPMNNGEKRSLQTVVTNLKRTIAQVTSGA
jgi:dihydrodipicolinate synthase/N-acetylneuraminate lyase